MRSPLLFLLSGYFAAAPFVARANNIQVSNVALVSQSTSGDTWGVQLTLTWENGWRTSTGEANHDAAWVFIKYRFGPNTDWRHAQLNSSGHFAPGGSTISPTSDLRGAFVTRSFDGIGSMSITNMQLRWFYGSAGVIDTDPVEVRVIAMEMVFVPQGSFAMGDGTTTNVNAQYELAQTGAPFIVGAESAITLGGAGATSLNAHNNASGFDDYNYTTTQTLASSFPKGFSAFYAMKYEVTEGQYVDFLNMLTPTQAAARFPNITGTDGHTIDDTGTAPDTYVTTAPERACGGLNFLSQMAYADWSGLRPLSEFEYEKLCRGNRPAVANENAWGTIDLYAVTATLANVGTATELVSNPAIGAIANHAVINAGNIRPWRAAGIAASFATPTRVEASAGYYGAMELSGNLAESYISVANTEARLFNGAIVGDGNLTAAGAADVSTWPTTTPGSVSRRGGSFQDPALQMRSSDRGGATFGFTNVNSGGGGRFGRRP